MSRFLDITAQDIAELSSGDLRALIGRICEAEVVRAGFPATSVTWGGDDNASDGGLDVEVQLSANPRAGDFVSRAETGVQVKATKMSAGKIESEMKPEGVLRPSIVALAVKGGAYIIASAESVSAKMRTARLKAIEDAVAGAPGAQAMRLDFFDSSRIATAVRSHPQLIPWVRERIGRPFTGWYAFGDWPQGAPPSEQYFVDGLPRLVDQTSQPCDTLTVVEGLERIRGLLAVARKIVRISGLSGTGKTRFVQALFDSRVGNGALPQSSVIYCDAGELPHPTPVNALSQLVHETEPVVLAVDNCPPALHRSLSELVASTSGHVSVLTVEFDVSEDVPDLTEAFRFSVASDEVIESLLGARLPTLAKASRDRIVRLSGGNARVALALGRNVRPGEDIAKLGDVELIKRLFEQRNAADANLLNVARAVCLVYQFNADSDTEEHPELDALAALANTTVDGLLSSVAELERRDLVQRRGVWRALLPQALADRLALDALSGIAAYKLTNLLGQGHVHRLGTSLVRRLGGLHRDPTVNKLAGQWLSANGVVGGFRHPYFSHAQRFADLAPAAIAEALSALERWVAEPQSALLEPNSVQRDPYIRVAAKLAYDEALFLRAARILVLIANAETRGHRHNGARAALEELCRIAGSGTHAPLLLRLSLITEIAKRPGAAYEALAGDLLESVLDTNLRRAPLYEGFGAHVRDGGWRPADSSERAQWLETAVRYACDWALSGSFGAQHAHTVVAKALGELVFVLEPSVLTMHIASLAPLGFWPEGWIAAQRALHSPQQPLTQLQRAMLEKLVTTPAPQRSVDLAKAHLFPAAKGLDIAEAAVDFEGLQADAPDPYSEAYRRTQELGRLLSAEPELDELLPGLLLGQSNVALLFGVGLGEASADPQALWDKIVALYEVLPEGSRDAAVLLGILDGVVQSGRLEAARTLMNQVETRAALQPFVACFVLRLPADEDSLAYLNRTLARSNVSPKNFTVLARSHFQWNPPWKSFADVVLRISRLEEGMATACAILCGRLRAMRIHDEAVPEELLECARQVLSGCSLGIYEQGLDTNLATLALRVFSNGCEDARLSQIIQRFFGQGDAFRADWYAFDELLAALFKLRPDECLDACFAGDADDRLKSARVLHQLQRNLENMVSVDALMTWAERDGSVRYPLVAQAVRCFRRSPTDGEQWSPIAMSILAAAPRRRDILEVYEGFFVPKAFSSARSDIVEGRRQLLKPFLDGQDAAESAWARELDAQLAARAAKDRISEAKEIGGFEH